MARSAAVSRFRTEAIRRDTSGELGIILGMDGEVTGHPGGGRLRSPSVECRDNRPTWSVIDLFAGAGGFTEGFVAAGFAPVFAVEKDPAAAATYQENFGDHVYVGDIKSLSADEVPSADVIVGGPPCQGFSQLGSRRDSDPRNSLWWEYVRIVERVRPKVFVIENVPQFLKSEHFERLLALTEPGHLLQDYRLAYGVLNAADYGVPQRRRRAVVIGSRCEEPWLPLATHGEEANQPWLTLRDALAGVPFAVTSTNLPKRLRAEGIPGPFKATEIHLGRTPTELSLKRYDQVPPGGNRFDLSPELLPPCWVGRRSGSTDVMGRLEWDKPALTIRTEFFKPEKGRYLHPQWDADEPMKRINRPITHWEAARIQGFPDDFVWCGTKIEIARQIGNAVPVELSAAIGRHVSGILRRAT